MAKKNTYTIPEYIDEMETSGLLEKENVSKEELNDSYVKILDADDLLREQVYSLRERGFDDNRIAAKLMIPVHKIKAI